MQDQGLPFTGYTTALFTVTSGASHTSEKPQPAQTPPPTWLISPLPDGVDTYMQVPYALKFEQNPLAEQKKPLA